MSAANLLTRIRLLAAGDTAHGLWGQAFQTWAATQPFDHVRNMFRGLAELQRWIIETTDASHVECRAAQERAFREAADDGRRYDATHDPAACPILKAAADAIRSRVAAHDIDPPTREAVNERIKDLAQALQDRYRREGEPDGLVALRADVAKAKLATWEPARRLKEARERYNHVGAAIAEADVLKAAAELKVVEDAHQAAQRRLWAEFGVQA
jgi:hypothetical protein